MNHLLMAPLFFSMGCFITWLSFSWEWDRDESKMCKHIDRLQEENRIIRINNYELRERLKEGVEVADNLYKIILKYKPQEKEKCQE